jgi:ABC-2 type transport system permease protein
MSKKSGIELDRETPVIRQSTPSNSTSGAAHQQTLRNIGLITGYEFKKRVRQRSFIITTILILVLVILGACVPTVIEYFTATSSSQTKMVVVNNAGPVAGMTDNALSSYIETTVNGTATRATGTPSYSISTASAGELSNLQKQVKDGTLSILLVLDRASNGDVGFTYYTNASSTGLTGDPHLPGVQALAGQLNVLDKASRLGLTPSQTGSLFAQPDFSVVNTRQGQNSHSMADTVTGYILAYVGVLLIFMSVYMYGYGVAIGVAEEKSSRIMEILVNAATPFQLMVGKIVGIGAAGLSQMAAFVVVGIGALLLQTPVKALLLGSTAGGLNLDITGATVTMLLLLLVYFLLGFLLYAALFAAMGALVKRQEELQNVIQPLMWLFTFGYLVSFIGVSSPDAAWVKVISYIPFWTPTTMLMRIGTGSVAWWEIALTTGLMIAAIYLCTVISARIYRFGVLMYGQKPGLRQLVKLVR